LLSAFFFNCSTKIKRFAWKLSKPGKGVAQSRARRFEGLFHG
jgi:hypothetical protein